MFVALLEILFVSCGNCQTSITTFNNKETRLKTLEKQKKVLQYKSSSSKTASIFGRYQRPVRLLVREKCRHSVWFYDQQIF